MRASHKLPIWVAVVSLLLSLGAASASAAAGNQDKALQTIEQEAVIKTSPDTLYYENMAIGVPKMDMLTVKNISGRTISITPYIKLNRKYTSYLGVSLQACDAMSEHCRLVSPKTRMSLPAGGSYKLLVAITLLDNLPKESVADITSPLAGDLQVRGDVMPGNPTGDRLRIIPKEESTHTDEPGQWLHPDLVLPLAAAGGSLVLAYCMIGLFKRKRNDNDEAGEQQHENH